GADTHRPVHHLAADLEGDECGVTIAGDELRRVERRLDMGDVLLRADGRDSRPDRRLEGGVAGGVGGALDQDVLTRLVAESGPVEDSLGGGGVACERVGHGEVARTDGHAGGDGNEHEAEPGEDCGLAMPSTPTADTSGEIVLMSGAGHGDPFFAPSGWWDSGAAARHRLRAVQFSARAGFWWGGGEGA